jgi:hypothetical protein
MPVFPVFIFQPLDNYPRRDVDFFGGYGAYGLRESGVASLLVD